MTATQTPGGAAGVQTPRPPTNRPGTRTPCQVAPHLFDVTPCNTPGSQVKAALWLCQRRCPALTWCQSRELVESHVTGGRVVDSYGRTYSTADEYGRRKKPTEAELAALWAKKPRECATCGERMALSTTRADRARKYCSGECKQVAQRRSEAEHARRNPGRRRRNDMPVTHCPKRHEYTPENTGRNAGGRRFCMTCRYGAPRTVAA